MASIVKQAITSGLWYSLLKYQLNNFCIRDIEEITKSLLCKSLYPTPPPRNISLITQLE